jgi:hypothetical protein
MMLEQHPNQGESMIQQFSGHKLDYEGLIKFCHNCNLLVGFDYFVNAKSFWCCFDLALPTGCDFKNITFTHLQMKSFKI